MLQYSFARQPILDDSLKLFAYEFLYRSMGNKQFQKSLMTAEVITSSVLDLGLDKAADHHPAFINMSYQDIFDNSVEALPNNKVILELLEDIRPDSRLIERVTELTQKGYVFALDDFVYSTDWDPLIELASIIKLDLTVSSFEENHQLIKQLENKGLKFLAEKVETYEEFERYKNIGCELFQGYFFCKPEPIQGRTLDANTLAKTKLLADINQKDISIDQLEKTIQQDPNMVFSLIKYLNSAHFAFPRTISSIKQAILILGLEGVKKWASLLCLRNISSKPNELMKISLTRAKLAESIATHENLDAPNSYFLLGLLSTLDAVLDTDMHDILTSISLAPHLTHALLDKQGEMGELLEQIIQYEHQNLSPLSKHADLPSIYLEACYWADEITQSLG